MKIFQGTKLGFTIQHSSKSFFQVNFRFSSILRFQGKLKKITRRMKKDVKEKSFDLVTKGEEAAKEV